MYIIYFINENMILFPKEYKAETYINREIFSTEKKYLFYLFRVLKSNLF